MSRAARKTTATDASAHPDAESTIMDLCREWRLVNAKREYDLAALPDTMEAEEALKAILNAAGRRIHEIEEALAQSEPDTLDDVQCILGVVLQNMSEEEMGEDRDRAMVAAAHKAMNRLRNKQASPTAPEIANRVARPIVDLEPAVHDLRWATLTLTTLVEDTLADQRRVMTEEEAGMLLNGAYRASNMAADLRAKYLAAVFNQTNPDG